MIVLDGVFIYLSSSIFGLQILSVQHSALQINMYAAALCYAVLVAGLYYFILYLGRSVKEAFLLGFVVYAVYELTNKALLKNWNWSTVVLDSLWGGTLFATTSHVVYTVSKLRF